MVHLPYWMASPALSSDASETAEKSFPEDFRILCVKIYNGWNQWIPKRFPEINPLANRLSSFRSAPGERAHIHGFPPGTSIGIYDYFTCFSQFCKREKTGIQWKFTIVLNLFAEIIVHLTFFTSVSMHQKMGIKSNNVFFKTSRYSIISLSMYFLDIPPFPPLDSHFMERQQQEISAKPSIKNEIKKFYSSI